MTNASVGSASSYDDLYLTAKDGVSHTYRVAIGYSVTEINSISQLVSTESPLISAVPVGTYSSISRQWAFNSLHPVGALSATFIANYAALILRKVGVDVEILALESLPDVALNPSSQLTTSFIIDVSNV